MQKFHQMSPDRTFVFHDREPSGGFRAVTFALIQCGEKVAIGEAWCSPKDQFSKKIGRTIAIGRAKKSMATGFAFESEPLTIKEARRIIFPDDQ